MPPASSVIHPLETSAAHLPWSTLLGLREPRAAQTGEVQRGVEEVLDELAGEAPPEVAGVEAVQVVEAVQPVEVLEPH